MMMEENKQKYTMYMTMLPVALYLGWLIGGIMKLGYKIDVLFATITYIAAHPFNLKFYYSKECTAKGMLIAFSLYIVFILYIESNRKKYMRGQEYGSAMWGSAKKLTRQLADRNSSKNRILSQNLRMSLNTRKTNLNNNLLIIGGSGKGKGLNLIRPNLWTCFASYIITDPKGELLRDNANFLIAEGYVIRVLNLVDMNKSDGFNPFIYIRSETDVIKLITNLIANTTPKGSHSSDPFWEKAEGLYLQSLFYYVWMECPLEDRNFLSVLKLMGMASVPEDGSDSELSIIMKELASRKGLNHPAVRQYYSCMSGAGDTIRSILLSANSRLAFLENEKIKRILSDDDMDIASLGTGLNGDGKTKTALFCVIPDNDKSYNFIVGMLYTLVFQELYYQADFVYDGRLPVPVTLWMDEFANVALPEDFTSVESTMRSREIYVSVVIQNMAQIKALFKDTWETIVGNCDTIIYLGGNEASSHEYFSKMLGKQTIDKQSNSETKGRTGSFSKSNDVLGRELMTQDEIRKLNRRKCLVFISGEDPVMDYKYRTLLSKGFARASKLGSYTHRARLILQKKKSQIEIIGKESIKYYKKMQDIEENVSVYEFSLEEFLYMSEEALNEVLPLHLYSKEKEEKQKRREEEVLQRLAEEREKNENTVLEYLIAHSLSEEQMKQVQIGLTNGLSDEDIMKYIDVENSPDKMQEMRLLLEMDLETL